MSKKLLITGIKTCRECPHFSPHIDSHGLYESDRCGIVSLLQDEHPTPSESTPAWCPLPDEEK